ncbi:helix-turn-helix domain-containing protein [Caldivirga maquilingensis]|uniref:Bacterio-opsin activator HTH domain protein n=1 Tax=Caldivirga maquilingensis (strain ATCC 700844 / DSM 13496 / JCM 10307 / IC-167) TaxID=397948 RepID=A8MAU9_CALMQ|nr:helix-turn-helix domain-containing protein [Caldivirga maquilingensis]ABW01135.1 Bacterio-opsin activator HTH domain protein [Caldivirga maquilingensis IC-167]
MIKVLIKAYRNDCLVQNTLSKLNLGFDVLMINISDGKSTHLISTNRPLTRHELDLLRESGLRMRKVNENVMWIESPSCSSCRVLGHGGFMVIEGKSLDSNTVIYGILLPSRGYLRSLMKDFLNESVKAEVVYAQAIKVKTLTSRQLEVLQLAYSRGLFDDKRRVSISELAKELGISPATLTVLIRRGIKKVLEDYFRHTLSETGSHS